MSSLNSTLIEDIGKIIVFLLLLLSLFLFTSKSKNKTSNYLFGSFLLVIAFDFSALFLKELFYNYPIYNNLRNASVFLQMPLYYFYVKKTCYSNYQLSFKPLLHVIPFLCFYILLSSTHPSRENDIFYIVASQCQYYAYFIAIFILLERFKNIHLANYSVQNEIYKWLKAVTFLFLIANTFVLLRLFFDKQNLYILNLGIFLFALVVICWFVLKTMRTPHLFSGIDKNIKPLNDGYNLKEKVAYKEDIANLSKHMDSKKPFLDNSLTVKDLSGQLNISEKHLSFLINKVLGKHFYDYINNFRIEEAKLLLKDKNLNIQEVMYKVGFNSKSSFNTAFKKNTQQTPSQFRKPTS